jgi:hypothetical protein
LLVFLGEVSGNQPAGGSQILIKESEIVTSDLQRSYYTQRLILFVIKLRARTCRASNTKPQQLRRFAVDRLQDRDVVSQFYDEFESELQGVQAQPQSMDEKSIKLKETIQKVATNTIGYTRKQANKEWFDEECAKENEEKNATRERAIQINTRGAKNAYKLAWTKERHLFRKNARQLDEEGLMEIE